MSREIDRQDCDVSRFVGEFLDEGFAERSRRTDRCQGYFELPLLELEFAQTLIVLGQVEANLNVFGMFGSQWAVHLDRAAENDLGSSVAVSRQDVAEITQRAG